MDREELLELLFGAEPSLLQVDTGLRSRVSDPVPDPVSDTQDAVVETVDTVVETVENATVDVVDNFVVDTAENTIDKDDNEVVEKRAGDKSTLSGTFCPAIALSRFPYKFIRDNQSQSVASEFFDKGKFWERTWDLYYLPVPAHISIRPLILLPASQAEQLVQEINRKFESCYTIPSADGFILDFQDDGTGLRLPQPAFLGRSVSRGVKDRLETGIAAVRYECSRLDEAVPEYQAFEQKIEAAVQLCKSKSKTASKAKRMQARLETELNWKRCLRRLQMYFGYSTAQPSEDTQPGDWKPDDPEANLAVHTMADEPIFISIDVESNERCHKQVTEIGISVLDTRDLISGQNAECTSIRSRHLRVREYAHVVNHDFVSGCPDRFEFGNSEWVTSEEAPVVIQEYLMHLFHSGGGGGGGDKRNLILVGHSPSADIRYLQAMKVPVFKEMTAFVETVDTAEIFRVARQEANTRSLAGVLSELGVTAWNLHNAGNDARYTMQAMLLVTNMNSPE